MKKILIVDDHEILRKGLKQILQEEFPDAVFGEANNGHEALEKTRQSNWQIIILDISMPGRNGLEVLKQLKIESEMRVLMFSMHPEEQYAIRCFKAGAWGYLNKASTPEELITAVKRILSGRKYITNTVAENLARSVLDNANKPLEELLSDREFQVLCLIASGKTITEIAENLCLSVATISTYRARLLEKMNMKTNAQLTRFAIKEEYVE